MDDKEKRNEIKVEDLDMVTGGRCLEQEKKPDEPQPDDEIKDSEYIRKF